MYITMYCVAIIKEEVMSSEKKQGEPGRNCKGGRGRKGENYINREFRHEILTINWQ